MAVQRIVEKKKNKFVISFDLSEPYIHATVRKKLQEMGAKRELSTTWYLESEESLDQLRTRLKRIFRSVDNFRVYEVIGKRGP